MQSNAQEQFVQIPLNIEHDPPLNLTSDSKQRLNKWLTIIICIIFVGTGQSIVRLLENYYFLHRNQSRHYGIWTQTLLQVVGFPIVLFLFLILLLFSKKRKQLLITSDGISLKTLAIFYPLICVFMLSQAIFWNTKYHISFKIFTPAYATQLLFTPFIACFLNKTKFHTWLVISVGLSFLAGALTFSTFSAGSANSVKTNRWRMNLVYCAALFFSLLLCTIRTVFEQLLSVCKTSTNRKQPSFIAVLELLIVTSLLATIFLVFAFFVSGEQHNLKREMNGFSKGEIAYVRTMVGQAAAWQIYWVGIIGLVFAVSALFSNVISVCTWPIVSLLVAFFYHRDKQYDIFLGIALGMATLSVGLFIIMVYKEKMSDDDEGTS